jgi:hypothetical protein
MRILHWDKKHNILHDDIQQDWRNWAANHGYTLIKTVPLSLGGLSIIFEIYQHQNPNHADPYLLYHPPIGHTTNTEILCVLPHETALNKILQSEKQMALYVMELLQQDDQT